MLRAVSMGFAPVFAAALAKADPGRKRPVAVASPPAMAETLGVAA